MNGCARLATILIMLPTSTITAMSTIMATMSTITTTPFGPSAVKAGNLFQVKPISAYCKGIMFLP